MDLYRCDDCFGRQLFCLQYFNKRHRTLPFHRARRWTPDPVPCDDDSDDSEEEDPESHFCQVTAAERGFSLQLGHGGDSCPHSGLASRQEMHIMHTNGIHVIPVVFCRCTQSPFWEQLLEHDLFPGTDDTPRSAFSFAALEHFHAFNLVCKTAARDFKDAIRRMSNGAFPDLIPVSFQVPPEVPSYSFPKRHSPFPEYVPAFWASNEAMEDSHDAQAGGGGSSIQPTSRKEGWFLAARHVLARVSTYPRTGCTDQIGK